MSIDYHFYSPLFIINSRTFLRFRCVEIICFNFQLRRDNSSLMPQSHKTILCQLGYHGVWMTIDISRYHKVLISTEACLFWDMKTKLKKNKSMPTLSTATISTLSSYQSKPFERITTKIWLYFTKHAYCVFHTSWPLSECCLNARDEHKLAMKWV